MYSSFIVELAIRDEASAAPPMIVMEQLVNQTPVIVSFVSSARPRAITPLSPSGLIPKSSFFTEQF